MTDKWTIYRTDNGEITGVIESPDPETVALNIGEDEAAIPGEHAPGAYYVADGEALPLPPKPGPWAVWSGTEWVDPRTPEDIAAEEAAALAAERAGMVASRFQAKAALMQAGLLDAAEAAVAQSDPLTRLAWIEAVEYRRGSPAILAIAAAIGLTDAQVDDLFRAAMKIAA